MPLLRAGSFINRNHDRKKRKGTETMSHRTRWPNDRGQVTIFVVIAMAIFLIGFVGFAVDMTNLWFHRQMAQGAADAACQAGVMDLLVRAGGGGSVGPEGAFPLSDFDCVGTNYSPCQYASFNGYPATQAGMVNVSFPASIPGVVTPPIALTSAPFIRVDINDPVRMYFAPLITQRTTQDVHASAQCALIETHSPIPIIVLNPTCSQSFAVTGSAKVTIIGGPTKSIQVNSDNACAAATSSSGCLTAPDENRCSSGPPPAASCAPSNSAVDLTQAGPNFTGSDMGVFGGPSTDGMGGFWTGTTSGNYNSPATPIQDPYKNLPAPSPPPGPAGMGPPGSANSQITNAPLCTPGPVCNVNYGVNGCPDPAGCTEFAPGYYNQPIVVGSGSMAGVPMRPTAMFDPGLYYIAPTNYTGAASGGNLCGKAGCTDIGSVSGSCRADMVMTSGTIVRTTTVPGAGDTSYGGGNMFYMTSAAGGGQFGSVFFGSNTGSRIIDPMPKSNVTCNGADTNPPLPSNLQGNILLGPCAGPYHEESTDPNTGVITPIRGMLFFQDRSNKDPRGQSTFQGNGTLILAGTLYFHNCPNSLAGACSPYNTDYNAFVQFQGTPGSLTRVVGNVVVDQFVLAGNASVNMILDPNRLVSTLKATLVQ